MSCKNESASSIVESWPKYSIHKYDVFVGKLKRSPLADSSTSTFCAACGNATCSEACHTAHYEETGMCHFHTNFTKEAPVKNLLSLPFDNIYYADEMNFPIGTPLNKTSQSYMVGMRHPVKEWVYLQRGFRDYGTLDVN